MATADARLWRERRTLALRFVATFYLIGVFLEGAGYGAPVRVLPRFVAYFMQISALFPRAATASIDYRAEAYVCDKSAWQELDTRPYFPIDANDKESRFQRVMYFYRRQKMVMKTLDRFLVESHNEGKEDDMIPRGERVGGVRLFSLRLPIPNLGDKLAPWRRVDLAEVPENERKTWYQTSSTRVTERCFGKTPREKRRERPKEDDGDEPAGPANEKPSEDPSDPHPKDDPP